MENDLTLTQTARVLGVNVVTVRRMIHAGNLEAYAVNPDAQRLAYRVRVADVEAMRQRNRVSSRNAAREEART